MSQKKPGQTVSRAKVVRAWKDPSFRASLTAEELLALPPHPSGAGANEEEGLKGVVGGFTFTSGCTSAGCFTACNSAKCSPNTPCY